MLSSYYTVKAYGEHEQILQKSRFIGYIQRAETEEEAQAFIQSIKKKHPSANHNCSAYLIGENDHIQKANDDGEPNGTAGLPMLEVLKKRKLKNTVVVITRYFGGIKLGAGGLIRAYGSTTSKVLDATGIVERQRMTMMSSAFDYHLLGKVENEIRNAHYLLKGIEYLEKVIITTAVREGEEEQFSKWLINVTAGQVEIAAQDKQYIETEL
ncbi:YigZ family protein [Pseudalkalibacillus berkeleyi]|uniref:YigZ family protein n=1 Tax=Pseudalkalibacillus berkeleyi TaxID=1069813 RepID=A0ABS9H3T9_9BACL|nr:YigZ family protein [Pseudalkalibacillus berkeleyi]MCF6138766.1 YigZ family protein [Pseudalkalibacillus berkeleyi]